MINEAKQYITKAWENCPSSEIIQTHAKNLTIALPVINFSFLAIAACARQLGLGIDTPIWPYRAYPLDMSVTPFDSIAAPGTVLAGATWAATSLYTAAKSIYLKNNQPTENSAQPAATSTTSQANFAQILQKCAKIATIASIIYFRNYEWNDVKFNIIDVPTLVHWTIFEVKSDDDLICKVAFPIIAISALTWGVSALYTTSRNSIRETANSISKTAVKACALLDVNLSFLGIKTDEKGLNKLKKIICGTFALLAVTFGALALNNKGKTDLERPILILTVLTLTATHLAIMTFIPKYFAVNYPFPSDSSNSTPTKSIFDKLKNIVCETYFFNIALDIALPIVFNLLRSLKNPNPVFIREAFPTGEIRYREKIDNPLQKVLHVAISVLKILSEVNSVAYVYSRRVVYAGTMAVAYCAYQKENEEGAA